jgi:hypothetical protein
VIAHWSWRGIGRSVYLATPFTMGTVCRSFAMSPRESTQKKLATRPETGAPDSPTTEIGTAKGG